MRAVRQLVGEQRRAGHGGDSGGLEARGGDGGCVRHVCETLFDVLFANLPTSATPPERASVPTKDLMRDATASVETSGKGQNSVIAWSDDAKALAEKTLKRVPFFVRVSVNKKLG